MIRSKLLVSPLITHIIVPYRIPIEPPFREFSLGSDRDSRVWDFFGLGFGARTGFRANDTPNMQVRGF